MVKEDYHHLPCGCSFWNEGDKFFYQPCSPLCKFYIYALEQAKEKHIPMIRRLEG
jgi:hypothetical protein